MDVLMNNEDSKRLPQRMGRLVQWRYSCVLGDMSFERRIEADLAGKVAPRILGRDWKGSESNWVQTRGWGYEVTNLCSSIH